MQMFHLLTIDRSKFRVGILRDIGIYRQFRSSGLGAESGEANSVEHFDPEGVARSDKLS
jgi:hypothetical protein